MIVFRIRTCGSHEAVEEHAATFEFFFFRLGCHPQKPYPYNLSRTVKTGYGYIAIVACGFESYPTIFKAYVGHEFLICILWVEFLCPYPVDFGDSFNLFARRQHGFEIVFSGTGDDIGIGGFLKHEGVVSAWYIIVRTEYDALHLIIVIGLRIAVFQMHGKRLCAYGHGEGSYGERQCQGTAYRFQIHRFIILNDWLLHVVMI